ncbi:MAG: phosphate/phosphite/phosphonate ABC transporter substrate-binding protein [Magnetococcales bacterium]|nr:phosphate/phosphite/phosphonate ABC transporter substrate-binding protein [Magnetococcales bacterium]
MRLLFLLTLLLLPDCRIADANSLTMGTIGNSPVEEIRRFTPVIRKIAALLQLPEIDGGEVVMAADIPQMAELLKNGKVDFYYDSPLPSLAVNHLAGSEMVLRRWKHDHPEYTSLIFVKKESTIQDLAGLNGEVIGFKDEFSSSGHLLPRIAMEEAGLRLAPLPERAPPARIPGQTGYLFTRGNENSIVWVSFGRIAAGTISREEFLAKSKGDLDQLRILHETFPIPRQVINFRSGLPDRVKSALMRTLTGLEESTAGKEVLRQFEKTTRFDPLPREAMSRLESIKPIVLKILGLS